VKSLEINKAGIFERYLRRYSANFGKMLDKTWLPLLDSLTKFEKSCGADITSIVNECLQYCS